MLSGWNICQYKIKLRLFGYSLCCLNISLRIEYSVCKVLNIELLQLTDLMDCVRKIPYLFYPCNLNLNYVLKV